jgi:hypothetical protein
MEPGGNAALVSAWEQYLAIQTERDGTVRIVEFSAPFRRGREETGEAAGTGCNGEKIEELIISREYASRSH